MSIPRFGNEKLEACEAKVAALEDKVQRQSEQIDNQVKQLDKYKQKNIEYRDNEERLIEIIRKLREDPGKQVAETDKDTEQIKRLVVKLEHTIEKQQIELEHLKEKYQHSEKALSNEKEEHRETRRTLSSAERNLLEANEREKAKLEKQVDDISSVPHKIQSLLETCDNSRATEIKSLKDQISRKDWELNSPQGLNAELRSSKAQVVEVQKELEKSLTSCKTVEETRRTLEGKLKLATERLAEVEAAYSMRLQAVKSSKAILELKLATEVQNFNNLKAEVAKRQWNENQHGASKKRRLDVSSTGNRKWAAFLEKQFDVFMVYSLFLS